MSLPPTPEPLFLLYTGAIYAGERDDWDTEPVSGKDVDKFADTYPEQTVGLIDEYTLRAYGQQCADAERERCIQAVLDAGPKDGALRLVSEGFAAAIRSAKPQPKLLRL